LISRPRRHNKKQVAEAVGLRKLSGYECSLRYATLPQKVALYLVAVFAPIYLLPLIALFAGVTIEAVSFVIRLLTLGIVADAQAVLWVLLLAVFCLLLAIPAVTLLFYVLGDRIYMTADGIWLPCWYRLAGNAGGFLPWRELTEVRVLWSPAGSRAEERRRGQALILYRQSGPPVKLNVDSFSQRDFVRFLEAFESRSRTAVRTSGYLELKEELTSGCAANYARASFTEIWQMSMPPDASGFKPLPSGTSLQSGDIEILRYLSGSSRAAYYMAHTRQGQLVLLKECVIPAGFTDTQAHGRIALFADEVKCLLTLDHPKIIKVTDHFVDCQRHFARLSFYPGLQNLNQMVHQFGPQKEEVVIQWAGEMVSVLAYLHGREPPLAHGLLTPESFWVLDGGGLMLIDLGVAGPLNPELPRSVVGFQAPEREKGAVATPPSDLFSLGAILYFLLTGCCQQARQAARPRLLASCVSAGLDELVAALTAPDVSVRLISLDKVRRWLAEGFKPLARDC